MTFALRSEEVGQRLVLGAGVRHELVDELGALGVGRPLLLASPSSVGLAGQLAAEVSGAHVAALARGHVPRPSVDAARATARLEGCEAVVAVGGGAATGLAKAVAVEERLPALAVPTTLAGSEATPVWAVTEDGRKRTGRDRAAQPRVVLADPEAMRGVPREVVAASGLNAVAHAAAAYSGPAQSVLSRLLAAEGARRLLATLSRAVAGDLDARAECLFAAQLTARGFAIAGSGPHHRMCHALGGRLDLPHAPTHAALLPHTLAALDWRVRADLADDLGVDDPVASVTDLAARLAVPAAVDVTDRDAAVVAAAVEAATEAAAPDLEEGAARAAVRAGLGLAA